MSSVEGRYRKFKNTLDCGVTSYVPEAKSSQPRRNIYMTSSALQLRKWKNSLWWKSVVTNDPVDKARFRSRNRLRRLTRQLRKGFEAQLVAEIKSNQKTFWKYSNSRLKTKPRIANLKDASGLLVSKGEEKAAILNAYFSSMFTHEDRSEVPSPPGRAVTAYLTDVNVTQAAVQSKLSTLNVTSAPGPDDIHPRVLQEAHCSLSAPLSHIFRRSLDTGCIPCDWTFARVVPIYKKGGRQDPSNYRPVSLTAIPCKVLKSLIRWSTSQSRAFCQTTNMGFAPGAHAVPSCWKSLKPGPESLSIQTPSM